MAIVDVGLPQDIMMLAFRGTVGYHEWLSYLVEFPRELLTPWAHKREVYAQWDDILDRVSGHGEDGIGTEGTRALREKA